jgi:hypothetical protein
MSGQGRCCRTAHSIEWGRDLVGLRSGQPPSVIDEHADAAWDRELDDLFLSVGHRFGRADLRRRIRDYVRGLLAPVGRKNGWQLAEFAGHRTPDGPQRLLNGATWDADGVRDDLQSYVAQCLGEDGGVLVIDDTGFVKKDTTSAGSQKAGVVVLPLPGQPGHGRRREPGRAAEEVLQRRDKVAGRQAVQIEQRQRLGDLRRLAAPRRKDLGENRRRSPVVSSTRLSFTRGAFTSTGPAAVTTLRGRW